MTLGHRLKALRKERGLTQEELGNLLGVTKASIQKYENGVIQNIKPRTIEKLAEVFNIESSYLLGIKFDDIYPIEDIMNELNRIEISIATLTEMFDKYEKS